MKKIELIETTAVDRGLNAGRPATNTDPRPPMSATTYTMFVGNDAGADEIVARGVPLRRALVIALEHGSAGNAAVVHSDIGSLRYFAIGRRPADGRDFECATYTIVRRSGYPGVDSDMTLAAFEQCSCSILTSFGRVAP